MIRVVLPYHLRSLAGIDGEAAVDAGGPPSVRSVLEALENKYPVLRGAIRDHGTLKRRPFVRFYVCKDDWSLEDPEILLPESIVNGSEPFIVMQVAPSPAAKKQTSQSPRQT